jgi:hypothetical protein
LGSLDRDSRREHRVEVAARGLFIRIDQERVPQVGDERGDLGLLPFLACSASSTAVTSHRCLPCRLPYRCLRRFRYRSIR